MEFQRRIGCAYLFLCKYSKTRWCLTYLFPAMNMLWLPSHVFELEKDRPQQKTRATRTQHTQAYIKLHTSIYISIPTSNTQKHIHKTKQTHTHKHTQKHTQKLKQTPTPKQHPKNNTAKKSITLYNSKYCIRVVLRKKFNGNFCSIVPLHLSCLPVRRFQEKHSSAPLL